MLDIAANHLPSSLMFLGAFILSEKKEIDRKKTLNTLFKVALCRACTFRHYCQRAEVGEETYLYLSAPSAMRA